ncbi:MAG: uracil-DNA glycosylase [Kiritimatiellae bacterium]|nr:uracil-DNA glycosylase [Kiritimatiellia bacterium]
MSAWTAIIDDVIDHVNLLKELGERSVELDPALMRASAKPVPAPVSSPAQSSVFQPPSPAAAPASSPATTPEARRAALDETSARIDACDACALRQQRTRSVPGQGNFNSPDVMFIGEAPGYEEDKQGLAFVGAAGQLLTKMIAAMGYTRDDVFIANICKCRPPGNRAPLPEEMQKCLPFLREQIKIIRPKTIVLLGGTAIKALLETQAGVNRIQGQWTQYEGIPVMPTFHPSYLLRFEPAKHDAWRALKLVLAHLGKPVPGTAK